MLRKQKKQFFLFSILLSYLINIDAQNPTMGLLKHSPSSIDNGYVLFAPNSNSTTFLIDKCGSLVHSWNSSYLPGLSVYFLPDGNLLRTGYTNNTTFSAGGSGGVIERMDWNGNVLWSYMISDNSQCQHHDIVMLPNGNIIAVVWEFKTRAEAIAAGRDSTLLGAGIWSEKLVEIQPVGTNSANIVWEWHAWDHLIQEHDNTKGNFGSIVSNPQLLDVNYRAQVGPDWLHFNSIDYNLDYDQIMFSSRQLDEIYIIDHSTTTAESASHSGGIYGKGGDFLYRWGNSEAYGFPGTQNHQLFGQHNAHWIPSGNPNAGKIMIFNNGNGRTGGNYSSVDIINPVNSSGNYDQTLPFGPNAAEWSYHDTPSSSFYSAFISGAQQLINGNVLICNGMKGEFFEVDPLGNKVWRYINPVGNSILTQGTTPTANSVFRCTFYPDSYSGFSGKTLTPLGLIEQNPYSYPIVNSPTNVNLYVSAGCTATVSSLGTPLVTDCNVLSVINDAPSSFSLGNTVVTWTVTDLSMNNTIVTQTVMVSDTTRPSIIVPANVIAYTNSGCYATGVSIGTPTVNDNCSIDEIINDAPSVFPAGNSIITWTVSDVNGNSSVATQTVSVLSSITSTQSVTKCWGDALVLGSNSYTSSGTYTDTLSSVGGCDSIAIYYLTIENAIDVSVSVSDLILTSNATGVSYQWMDCNSQTLINGATSQSYTVTNGGNYSVIITDNYCIDTSECSKIDIMNVEQISSNYSIYPNPTSGEIFINYKKQYGQMMFIEVYDQMGRILINERITLKEGEERYKIDLSELSKGVYMLFLSDDIGNKHCFQKKVIIQ